MMDGRSVTQRLPMLIAARTVVGCRKRALRNETRSSIGSFGEVPNRWQRNHGSKKADQKNVQRVGVGVIGHSILHHHEENVGALS